MISAKIPLFLSLFIFALVAVACGGDGTNGTNITSIAADEEDSTAAFVSPSPEETDRTTPRVTITAATSTARSTTTPEDETPESATNAVSPTATRFVFPASIQATSVCRDSPRTRLILNERARVSDDDQRFLNIRSGPGVDYEAIGQLAVGQVFLVVDGPQCGGDYTWYFIRYKGVEGWIAEGEDELYYVEPYLPG